MNYQLIVDKNQNVLYDGVNKGKIISMKENKVKFYLIYHNTIQDRGFLKMVFMSGVSSQLKCEFTMDKKEAIKFTDLEKALRLCDYVRNSGMGMCKIWEQYAE